MCYNKETSILMYIIGVTLSIILYFTGDKYDKHIALAAFVTTQMQLAEFFMWYDEDCTKGINNIATYTAYIILITQASSIIIGAIIFKTTHIPNNILYAIFAMFMMAVFYAVSSNIEISRKKCSKNKKDHPHLIWDLDLYYKNYVITTIFYYLIFLIFLFLKDFKKGIIVMTILVLLLLDSIYNTTTYIREYESVWCLKTISVPFFIILYNIIKSIL